MERFSLLLPIKLKYVKFVTNIFLGGRGRERGSHKQTPTESGAPIGALSHDPEITTGAETKSQKLN